MTRNCIWTVLYRNNMLLSFSSASPALIVSVCMRERNYWPVLFKTSNKFIKLIYSSDWLVIHATRLNHNIDKQRKAQVLSLSGKRVEWVEVGPRIESCAEGERERHKRKSKCTLAQSTQPNLHAVTLLKYRRWDHLKERGKKSALTRKRYQIWNSKIHLFEINILRCNFESPSLLNNWCLCLLIKFITVCCKNNLGK